MILDHIKNSANYAITSPRVFQALEILRKTNFEELKDGTYLVDGNDFRYSVQSFDTKASNDTPEAHRDYIDIQYVISGTERMGVGQVEDMALEVEARPESDIWFYHGALDTVTVKPGMFAVFFPNDAHAPGISPVEGTNHVRKCVFKVHI